MLDTIQLRPLPVRRSIEHLPRSVNRRRLPPGAAVRSAHLMMRGTPPFPRHDCPDLVPHWLSGMIIASVPPCTRFPTPSKKGLGRPGRASLKHLVNTIMQSLLIVLLLLFAVGQRGGSAVALDLALKIAFRFLVAVGGRVEGRT